MSTKAIDNLVPVESTTQMTQYQSKKKVHASKIWVVRPESAFTEAEANRPDEGGARIIFTNHTFINVDKEYMDKHNPKVGGYLVIYVGGYMSWSPADAFEEGNKPVDTFMDRLFLEKDDLAEKVEKLTKALEGKKIPASEVEILSGQLSVMRDYLAILETRINKHTEL